MFNTSRDLTNERFEVRELVRDTPERSRRLKLFERSLQAAKLLLDRALHRPQAAFALFVEVSE